MARIMIVHQYPMVRQGLRSLMRSAEDIQIVAEATQREQMLWLVRKTSPDVVLLDGGFSSDLPGYSTGELVAQLYQAGARGIFVLAPSVGPVDEEQFFQLVKCGAVAYEQPNITGPDLLEKIRRVSNGECLISSALLSLTLVKPHRYLLDKAPEPIPPQEPVGKAPETQIAPGADFQLSKRELEVLREVLRGHRNKQIGAILHISDQTVKNHIATIRQKMRMPDRTTAVVLALRLHLLSLEDFQCPCEPKCNGIAERSKRP